MTTVQVSDDTHNMIKEKLLEFQRKYKKYNIMMPDVTDSIIIAGIDRAEDVFVKRLGIQLVYGLVEKE